MKKSTIVEEKVQIIGKTKILLQIGNIFETFIEYYILWLRQIKYNMNETVNNVIILLIYLR